MEPLAYVEMAVVYEEFAGPLEPPTFSASMPRAPKLRQLWTWAAIAAMILFGGFGAVVSTGFSSSDTPPEQHSTPF